MSAFDTKLKVTAMNARTVHGCIRGLRAVPYLVAVVEAASRSVYDISPFRRLSPSTRTPRDHAVPTLKPRAHLAL